MINLDVSDRIVDRIRSLCSGYEIKSTFFKGGDFGDLRELDFSDGSKMGHISIWSSGNVFFNLFNNDLSDNYEIIPETHFDTSEMGEDGLVNNLQQLFDKMDNRKCI